MSDDMQLVLLGGGIAIASSLVTTVLASLLGYWLEERREKRRLRTDLMKVIANMEARKAFLGEMVGEPQSFSQRSKEIDKVLNVITKNWVTMEQIAVGIGTFQAHNDMMTQFNDMLEEEYRDTINRMKSRREEPPPS